MMSEILPGMDKEISQLLRKEYSRKGIEFHLNARVLEAKDKTLRVQKDEQVFEIKAGEILVSTGRKPVIKGFGLENLGVEIVKGGIKTDEHCRTNIPNVYAAGDVTGFSMLAHTASREGEVAVNHIAGRSDRMRYKAIPGVVYTNPEVAVAGLTEEEAREKGMEVEVQKLPMTYAGRFVAENDLFQGLCKIVSRKKIRRNTWRPYDRESGFGDNIRCRNGHRGSTDGEGIKGSRVPASDGFGDIKEGAFLF